MYECCGGCPSYQNSFHFPPSRCCSTPISRLPCAPCNVPYNPCTTYRPYNVMQLPNFHEGMYFKPNFCGERNETNGNKPNRYRKRKRYMKRSVSDVSLDTRDTADQDFLSTITEKCMKDEETSMERTTPVNDFSEKTMPINCIKNETYKNMQCRCKNKKWNNGISKIGNTDIKTKKDCDGDKDNCCCCVCHIDSPTSKMHVSIDISLN